MRTELASPRYRDLDLWPVQDVISALWAGQMAAVSACHPMVQTLSEAVEAAAQRLETGSGRLIYTGAGSAGLVAALDALDLETTFSWPQHRLALLLASGLDLSKGLQSGNEDNSSLGQEQTAALALTKNDVLVAVSASGASAYTLATLQEARRHGALAIAVTSNRTSPLASDALYAVVIETDAEVVAGSTRLGAGTAQKTVLNLFSTALMVRLGLVHSNLMIDMKVENDKLQRRGAAMVEEIARVPARDAADALARYGSVKRAVLGLAGVIEAEIDPLLHDNRNNLRRALNAAQTKNP